MMEAGHVEVTATLNVLLDLKGVAKLSDQEASSSTGMYVTEAGVQTDRHQECMSNGSMRTFRP